MAATVVIDVSTRFLHPRLSCGISFFAKPARLQFQDFTRLGCRQRDQAVQCRFPHLGAAIPQSLRQEGDGVYDQMMTDDLDDGGAKARIGGRAERGDQRRTGGGRFQGVVAGSGPRGSSSTPGQSGHSRASVASCPAQRGQ